MLYLSSIFNTCNFCFKKDRFVLRSWKVARGWVDWHWLCGIGKFLYNNPFPIPCNLNPLNSVPKRDSDERRIIVDLSFPKGDSVNATIPKNSYLGEPFHLTFPTVDALIAMVKHKGQGCALFKRDLQRVYRQIPVDPGDIHHLGYKWRGDLFFDVMLPMGLRSAALCCQRTTNLITHIARKRGLTVENYLDDFMGAETWDQAASSFQILGDVLFEAGLVEASDKACPPACVVVCLGIVFNTRELSLTITPDRLSEVLGILEDWEGRMSASRHDLQVLLGKLHFVACCVRPWRVFVSRLLNFLCETPPMGKVSIPAEARKDVAWWLKFMPLYNGVSMIPWEEWSVPDSVMSSDACLVGCGAWVEGQYFHAQFPDFILAHRPSINSLELLAIVVAIKLWGPPGRANALGFYVTTWSQCRCSTLAPPRMSSCRTVCERFVSSWPCMRSSLGLNILLASKIGWLTCAPGCTFQVTIRCFMNAIKFGALSLRWSPLSF